MWYVEQDFVQTLLKVTGSHNLAPRPKGVRRHSLAIPGIPWDPWNPWTPWVSWNPQIPWPMDPMAYLSLAELSITLLGLA